MDGRVNAYCGDAAVCAADKVAGEQVVFYQLSRKFVDDERSIPDEASGVMYYALAVGHHTGVIDCFQERLRCSMELYSRVCALFEDEPEAKYKLEGIMRSGEIQIDKSHLVMVGEAVSNVAVSAALAQADEDVRSWVTSFSEMIKVFEADSVAYIMGRRRVS